MIEALTHDSFEPCVGTGFAISSEGYDDVLTLVEVVLGNEDAELSRRPFLLLFDGARTDAMFNARTFTLTHAEMGAIDVFILPVGRNSDGTFRYQAPFN